MCSFYSIFIYLIFNSNYCLIITGTKEYRILKGLTPVTRCVMKSKVRLVVTENSCDELPGCDENPGSSQSSSQHFHVQPLLSVQGNPLPFCKTAPTADSCHNRRNLITICPSQICTVFSKALTPDFHIGNCLTFTYTNMAAFSKFGSADISPALI